MKKTMIFVVVLCVIFPGCSQKQDKNNAERITPEFVLSISENDEGHIFTVKTNLPDETELITSLCDMDENILAQDKDTVKNGMVSFGPFRNKSEKIHGKYIFDVTMPVMSVQPLSVKKILGENGENLSGVLVFNEFDSIGVTQSFAIEL
jgi:hypothetical protein